MTLLLERNKHFLFLALLFFVAEILVNPLGNFPLNDDWSYAQVLKIYYLHGGIFLGNVPAMTLCTQILWGFLFTKLFGFSFFVLRCSTLLASLAGLYFLNRLIFQLSGNRQLAFLGCLVLLFNPLVFNLSNTYMTDVNFNTLIIICCYCIYNFLHTQKLLYYVLFVVFSLALVLLRQYGIIVPACFIAASLFLKEKKIKTLLLSLAAFIVIVFILKIYEHYLNKVLPPGAAYKFSGNISLLSAQFWNTFFSTLALRRREIILHLLAYPMPLAVVFIVPLIKRAKVLWVFIVLLADAFFIYWLYNSTGISSPSTFMNTMLGNELFHESVLKHHNESLGFDQVLTVIKYISSFITFFVLLLGMTLVAINPQWRRQAGRPDLVFFVLLVFAYTFMILITESYFDRYHIPLITLVIILLAYLGRAGKHILAPAWIPLLFWAWIAVAGTKDYLQWNRLKWEAYWYLRRDLKVPSDRINAGIDVVGWNEGNGSGWRDHITLTHMDYLIQFNPEADFVVPFKAYEFQRYYPYKKDKIYIFARATPKNKKQ